MGIRIISRPNLVRPVTPDGLTGFDEYNQFISWTEPNIHGMSEGRPIADVRNSLCYICGKQWALTSVDLRNQTHDRRGNAMHYTCLQGYNKILAYQEIEHALIEAGYLFDTEEVPSRYAGGDGTPWQRVKVLGNDKDRTDTKYRIVLGKRKKVWEIRFHNTSEGGVVNGPEVMKEVTNQFDDVDDTKGHSPMSADDPAFGPYYYVHAWTHSQLEDYLTRFRKLIPVPTNRYEIA